MDERKRVSLNQERRLAKKSGSRLHGGSGSGDRRNDMHNDAEVLECKTTLRGKKQITIKIDDLKLVERTAVSQGRTPVLHVELANRGYVILTEEDYAEMSWRQDDGTASGGGA